MLISFSRKAPLGGSCRACEAERGLHYNLAFSTYFKLLAIGSNDNVTMVEGRQHLRPKVLQTAHYILIGVMINLFIATANQRVLWLHLADEQYHSAAAQIPTLLWHLQDFHPVPEKHL